MREKRVTYWAARNGGKFSIAKVLLLHENRYKFEGQCSQQSGRMITIHDYAIDGSENALCFSIESLQNRYRFVIRRQCLLVKNFSPPFLA